MIGDADQFCSDLAIALDLYAEWLPRPVPTLDEEAARELQLRTSRYLGDVVHEGAGGTWAIVVDPPPDSVAAGGRTVVVRAVASAAEALTIVDSTVQTVAVTPDGLREELRTWLAQAGASRIVDVGMTNIFRAGGTHDEMYPLRHLVRLVACEQPSSVHVKGIDVMIDQPHFFEEDRFLEFVP